MADEKNYKEIYEQFFLHARHQETQRMMFTVFYGAAMSGVLAFLAKLPIADANPGDLNTSIWYAFSISAVFAFLFLLSLFGFYLSISLYVPFVIYSRQAELTSVLAWSVPEELKRFSAIKIDKPSLGTLFVRSYAIMAAITLLFALGALDVAIWKYSTKYEMIPLSHLVWISILLLGWLLYRISNRMIKLQKNMSTLHKDFNSKIAKADAQTQEAMALLKILALGNRHIEAGKVRPAAEVLKRLREHRENR